MWRRAVQLTRKQARVLLKMPTGRIRQSKSHPLPRRYPPAVDELRQNLVSVAPWARVPGLHVTLSGQLPSGKNQIGLRWEDDPSETLGEVRLQRLVKHPNRRFSQWRDDALKQLQPQLAEWRKSLPIVTPVMLYIFYWPKDRRIRDRSGMLDALFHLLERSGIVADDGLIEDPLWRTMPLDKKHPRVVIVLRPYFPLDSPTLSYRPHFDRPSCAHCWMPTSLFPLSIPA